MLHDEDYDAGEPLVLRRLVRPQSLEGKQPVEVAVADGRVVGVIVVAAAVAELVREPLLAVAVAGQLVLELWHEVDVRSLGLLEYHDSLHVSN